MVMIVLIALASYPIVLVCYKGYVWYYNTRIYPKKKHKWDHNLPGSREAGPRRPEMIDDKNVLGPVTTIWVLILMILGAGISV